MVVNKLTLYPIKNKKNLNILTLYHFRENDNLKNLYRPIIV